MWVYDSMPGGGYEQCVELVKRWLAFKCPGVEWTVHYAAAVIKV